MSESKEYSGIGLGLYSVNKIISVLKGEIKIDSNENNGTKVIIEIPY